MPQTLINLTILGRPVHVNVTTDVAGNLMTQDYPADELPDAARKLMYNEAGGHFAPTLICLRELLRVVVPLAAHGLLTTPGLQPLAQTATEWPHDLGGTGERPTRAECLAYALGVDGILTRLASENQLYAGYNNSNSGATPLLMPFIHAVAKNMPGAAGMVAGALAVYPTPANETIVLDYLESRLDNDRTDDFALAEFFTSERTRLLALRAIEILEPRVDDVSKDDVRKLLTGLLGLNDPKIIAFARRFLDPGGNFGWFKMAAFILIKAAPDRLVIDREIAAMLDCEDDKKRACVQEVMDRTDSTLRPEPEEDLWKKAFPINEETGERAPAPYATPFFYKVVTKRTLDYLTEALNHEDEAYATGSIGQAQVLFYYNDLNHWVKPDGSVVVDPDYPQPFVPLTADFLAALRRHSVAEIKDTEGHWHAASMTLASIGTRDEHTKMTVDYFLDRIEHPQHPLDPLVLPREIVHLVHRSERGDEIRAAAAGAMEGMPAGNGAGNLLSNVADALDDDLYYRLYEIARRRDILAADYEHGQIGYRRMNLREHPYRKVLAGKRVL